MDPAPGPGIMARSPRRIYSRGGSGGGGGCGRAWRPPGVRRAAGTPGGPAPSPSSTFSLACRSGAPPPWPPARRSLQTARAPRNRGNPWHPRHPAPAAAAVAPARRPAGRRSPPRGWVSGRGTRAREAPGCGAVGAELGPPPHASRHPCPAGARLPWPLRLGPSAPLPLAVPPGGAGTLPGAGGPGPQRRTRRHRTIFSEEQLQALEALFVQNQYPDVGTRERLAGRIRLREERVEVGTLPLDGQRVREGPGRLAFFFLLWKSRRWRGGAAVAAGGGAGGPGTAMGHRTGSRARVARHVRESVAGTGGEVQLVFLYFVLNFYFSWW